MVKPDPTRNYYADLEVQPNADTEEIKKQFRKLALKYHPDRNPGKEAEVVPRFQAIQAAHEILGDPTQRAKYDADRRKQPARSYNTSASWAPGRNPYTDVNSNFPPPPSRTNPRAGASQSGTGRPQSGADRFSTFPRPPPTAQRPTAARNDSSAKYSAWSQMGGKAKAGAANAGGAESAYRHFNPAQPPFGAYNPPNVPPNVPPRPNVGRSASTRTPRKAGFNPAAHGADEPMAASTSAYSTTNSRPVPPPPPRAFPQDDLSPLSEDVPFSEGRPRPKAPYASTQGERVHFDSRAQDFLRRSASQRNSPSRPLSSEVPTSAGDGSAGNSRPHRSVSPNGRKPFAENVYDSSPSENASAARKQGGNATRPFGMYDSSDDESPVPPSSRPAGQEGQASQPGDGIKTRATPDGRSQSSMYENSFFPNNRPSQGLDRSTDPHVANQYTYGKDEALPNKSFFARLSDMAKSTAVKGALPHWLYPLTVAPPSKRYRQSVMDHNDTTNASFPMSKSMPNSADVKCSRFTMPVPSDASGTSQAQMRSQSTESFNTTFSPNEWSGKFEGASGPFAPSPTTANSSRKKASPTRGRSGARPSPIPTPTNMFPPPPPRPPHNRSVSSDIPMQTQMPPPPPPGQPPQPQPAKFNPEEWAQTFQKGNLNWVPPPASEQSTSPTRLQVPRPTKTPKSRKATLQPQPATVNVAEDEPELRRDSSASTPSNGDGSAMDIDEDVPAAGGAPPTLDGVRSPRRVTVTPDKPEWREPPLSATEPVRPSNSASQGASNGASSFSLGGLNHVAPFGPSKDGLGQLHELKSTLPFPSNASGGHPQKIFHTAQNEILIPAPPKPPTEPMRISRASWTEYIRRMSQYMSSWQEYNNTLLRHFNSRETEVFNVCKAFTDPKNSANLTTLKDAGAFVWLGAMGDTTEGGFDSYLQGLKDDEKIREHWSVACEKHRETMVRCQGIRERVLRDTQLGRLPEV